MDTFFHFESHRQLIGQELQRTVMKLRESAFASAGEMQLYITILCEFLTLYATANSFHQLEVIDIENNETILFPARPGRQPLI